MVTQKESLENIKKLRELTGVGFSDCKKAIDECGGDIEKSIEFLRKKGIAKASKKMSRTASEGLVLVHSINGEVSIVEVNSETDFVAKNKDFISFCKEISNINHKCKGDLKKLIKEKMKTNNTVEDALVDLIAKIGEKIIIRRSKFFDLSNGDNFFYIHNVIEKNLAGKIISVVKINGLNNEQKDLGSKIAMHIAASAPLSIDESRLDKKLIDKELEIIKAELENSGKKDDLVEKIANGKIKKYIADNTLLNQPWFMEPKKNVSTVLNETSSSNKIEILDFCRFKLGEGV